MNNNSMKQLKGFTDDHLLIDLTGCEAQQTSKGYYKFAYLQLNKLLNKSFILCVSQSVSTVWLLIYISIPSVFYERSRTTSKLDTEKEHVTNK